MTKPDVKDTNPKDAIGIRKVPCSTVPGWVEPCVGLAMLEGARKYGRHNYRVSGVRASVYYDALQRHIKAWWEGEDIDPKSGLPHPIKAMACLVVLWDAQMNNKLTDDRPPKMIDPEWVEKLNELAGQIIDMYPDCKEPYTELGERAKQEKAK